MLSTSPLSRFAPFDRARRDPSRDHAREEQDLHPSLSRCRRAKCHVQGGTPLLGVAAAPPDLAPPGTRAAVAGRHALRILQLSTYAGSSSVASSSSGASVHVDEIADIRKGSRLGKNYGLNEVSWGHRKTNTKLATGCSNGAVIIWDLSKSGSRIDQTKLEHDRSVNRVVFAGQTGNWLLSAAQDGFMKLWDMRSSGPCQLALSTPGDPVRDVMFAPGQSSPYTIASVSESGLLFRWDLRKASAPVDRVQAHVGTILGLDWKVADNKSEFSSSASGGWCVTSGVDRTVKVWDMSAGNLASCKPTHTLHPSNAAYSISWVPDHPTQVAFLPLGVSAAATATEADNNPIGTDLGRSNATINSWTNDLEIWDVRREYIPKYVLKGADGTASALVLPTGNSAWTVHKSSGMFVQHDLDTDVELPLEGLQRATMSWSVNGELAFDSCMPGTHATQADEKEGAIQDQPFQPPCQMSIADQDFGFNVSKFKYLAEEYSIDADNLSESLSINAKVAQLAGYPTVSRLWQLLNLLFVEDTPFHHSSVTSTNNNSSNPTELERKIQPLQSIANNRTAWKKNDTATVDSYPDSTNLMTKSNSAPENAGTAFWQKYFASSTSKPTQQQSLLSSRGEPTSTDNSVSSPNDHLSGSQSSTTFSPKGRPTALVTDPNTLDMDALWRSSSVSNTSNHSTSDRKRKNKKRRSRIRTESGQGDFADLLGSSGESDDDSENGERSGEEEEDTVGMLVPPRAKGVAGSSASSLSAGSKASSVLSKALASQRYQLSPEQAPSIPHKGMSDTLGNANNTTARKSDYTKGSDGDIVVTKVPGDPAAVNMSRRPSDTTVTGVREQFSNSQNQQSGNVTWKGNINVASASDSALFALFRNLHDSLKNVLQELADQGDLQTAVVVMFVLRYRMKFDSDFLTRATQAYIDMLRQLGLVRIAAVFTKFSPIEKISSTSQESTTIKTTCKKCGKAMAQQSFGMCHNCQSWVTVCCICRERVKEMMLLCGLCGHGAHRACLSIYVERIRRGRKGDKFDTDGCPSGCGCVSCLPLSV